MCRKRVTETDRFSGDLHDIAVNRLARKKRLCRLFAWSIVVLLCSYPVAAAEQAATDIQTGEFSSSASIVELLGESTASGYASIMPIDELIEWQVYVPESYDPEKPAGLLVYISPTNSGQIPPGWKTLMDRFNLIWVAADDSGNRKAAVFRIIHAIMATGHIVRKYSIDQARVYVSGFSGGGRVASMVATEYAELFKGAIYNCGVNFWDDKIPVEIDKVRRNRYVFITGSKDFNLRDTKKVFSQYEKAGVEQIELMVIPRMGHRNPGTKDYGRAIAWLDGATED